MTALQLILFNVIVAGCVGLLVYAMTHDGKDTKKTKCPSSILKN
jgi:hypothetical protein